MKKFYYEPNSEEVIAREKRPSRFIAPHFHGLMEISYCFLGKQIVTIGDTTYELNAGDAILIFPYTMHGYLPVPELSNSQTENTAILFNVNTPSKLFPSLLTSTPLSPVIRAENVSEEVAHAFSKILESSSMLEKLGWAYIILSNLLEQVELSERKDIEAPALLVSMIAYINDNFTEQLSISTLAKKFAYSQSYIAHIFCDQLKISFKTYLNSIRCEHAANLLISTEKSITAVAHESGYNSINTFCRCFKKHFNQTPSQYRIEYSNTKKQDF